MLFLMDQSYRAFDQGMAILINNTHQSPIKLSNKFLIFPRHSQIKNFVRAVNKDGNLWHQRLVMQLSMLDRHLMLWVNMTD